MRNTRPLVSNAQSKGLPGNFSEMQPLRLHLLNQNLHFSKIPGDSCA